MVTRPVFSPHKDSIGVEEFQSPPFLWSGGFALSQKQKNVIALHNAIRESDPRRTPLEVSSKSTEEIGCRLSAFNLGFETDDGRYSVESVFQGSKVFEGDKGPYTELYPKHPAEARAFIHNNCNSKLLRFQFEGVDWELKPTRAFYDWIYCRALRNNSEYVEELKNYDCFTDIEFNPAKSLNCQAYAVSLYLSLESAGCLDAALSSKDEFLKVHPKDVISHVATNSVRSNGGRRKQESQYRQEEFDFK